MQFHTDGLPFSLRCSNLPDLEQYESDEAFDPGFQQVRWQPFRGYELRSGRFPFEGAAELRRATSKPDLGRRLA